MSKHLINFVVLVAFVAISGVEGLTPGDEKRAAQSQTISTWSYVGIVVSEIFALAGAVIMIILACAASYRIAFGFWIWQLRRPSPEIEMGTAVTQGPERA